MACMYAFRHMVNYLSKSLLVERNPAKFKEVITKYFCSRFQGICKIYGDLNTEMPQWGIIKHYYDEKMNPTITLHWHHNKHNDVSNHRDLDCLLCSLFGCRSKKTPKLRLTGFLRGIHRWPVDSPYKGPVMRKMFSFDKQGNQEVTDFLPR